MPSLQVAVNEDGPPHAAATRMGLFDGLKKAIGGPLDELQAMETENSNLLKQYSEKAARINQLEVTKGGMRVPESRNSQPCACSVAMASFMCTLGRH
jgi:hypothetical protein